MLGGMKIVLIGLVLLLGWQAGFGLLVIGSLGVLWIAQGVKDLCDGDPRGEDKIARGVYSGAAALLVGLLKLGFLFLIGTSLVKAVPTLLPWIKALLAQLGIL
jgi:hypothetical protein